MNNILLGILIFAALMNFLSFGVMLYDKASARDGAWRVSEGALFFLAICFGGLGIYLGMLTFHHKTRKWYFYFGVPLAIIQNFAFLSWLYQWLLKYVSIK
jgi:Predicted membrane protein